MSFVPHLLQQTQGGALFVQHQGMGITGSEQGLQALGDPDQGNIAQAQRSHGFAGGTQLAFASVDHHQTGQFPSLGQNS